MLKYKVGDIVQVFVAEGFTAISPTELEPYYHDFLRGDKLVVPSKDGWIDGVIVRLDPNDESGRVYEVRYKLPGWEGDWVTPEYVRDKAVKE